MLRRGNVADLTAAPELLVCMGRTRYVLADKDYDAAPLPSRATPRGGAVPVAPGRSRRKRKVHYNSRRYKGHLVENAFCRLKNFLTCRPLPQGRRELL